MSNIRVNEDGTWDFNNIVSKETELKQNIITKLNEYIGDCFFATDNGLDWNFLIGLSADQSYIINLEVLAVLRNIKDVISANVDIVNLDNNKLSIQYSVISSFGEITGALSV